MATKNNSIATFSEIRMANKSIVENLPAALQVECDKYFTLHASEQANAIPTDKQRARICMMLTDDKEALKASGFNTVKDFAEAVLDIGGSRASQYTFCGRNYFFNDNITDKPACFDWYPVSVLYELRGVSVSRIKEDCENGTLKPWHTAKWIRDVYAAKAAAEDPADPDKVNKAETVKMYAAHIQPAYGEAFAFDGTMAEIRAKMAECIGTDATIEEDRFAAYNPHAVEKQGDKEVTGKGLALVFGVNVVICVYYPLPRAKTAKQPTPPNYAAAAENMTDEEFEAFVAARKAAKAKAAKADKA